MKTGSYEKSQLLFCCLNYACKRIVSTLGESPGGSALACWAVQALGVAAQRVVSEQISGGSFLDPQ